MSQSLFNKRTRLTNKDQELYYKEFADDREAQILSRILENDPTITVPVVEITDEGFYSELYEPIIKETADIILQKINLVRRLHEIGVYHNDLGYHNFLIKDGVVKIIDFGSSFLMDDDEWLEALYENIYKNDGKVITSKEGAEYFELSEFIKSYFPN